MTYCREHTCRDGNTCTTLAAGKAHRHSGVVMYQGHILGAHDNGREDW